MEWQQYAAVEPFGEERADLRAGIIASVIANANRDPSKSEPFEPTDFMPKFGRTVEHDEPTPMDRTGWEQLKSMARELAGIPAA